MIWILGFLAFAFIASFLLTELIRRYSLARGLLDEPGSRRSHARPTPRGGGLAIALTVLALVPVGWYAGPLPGAVTAALLIGGVAVAIIGALDDYLGVAVRWRLTIHVLAAVAIVAAAGVPVMALPGQTTLLAGVPGAVVVVLAAAWFINLFNFMDGIDAIAGVEAVTTTLAAAVILFATGNADWALANTCLALASAGFLVWNLPPSRVFMGDGGSGFLGFALAAAAITTSLYTPLTLWAWLILFGVFAVDATVTLLRRAWRGERLAEPHRSHAYQNASRWLGRHGPVSATVAAINLGWLMPLAALATWQPSIGIFAAAVALSPLVGLSLWLAAGLPEQTATARG